MRNTGIAPRAFVIAACIVLSSCSSSSAPAPSPTAAPQFSNVSGDYTGTIQDAQSGSGTATATLAQQGSDAGGAITVTASSGTITAQVALSITASNAFSGAMVIDYPNGTTCTFTTTGTYSNNGTAASIAGSYTAVTNCAGDTGTYTMAQQCTDTVTAAERRIMTFPAQC